MTLMTAHDDELQRFSKGVRQLICVTTPADYRGGSRIFLSTALAEESQSMEL